MPEPLTLSLSLVTWKSPPLLGSCATAGGGQTAVVPIERFRRPCMCLVARRRRCQVAAALLDGGHEGGVGGGLSGALGLQVTEVVFVQDHAVVLEAQPAN